MRIWSLGSGSRGNAFLIECGESRLLVDAGFPRRTIERRLDQLGVAPGSVEALVITHEHGDHVRGAAATAARWGWALHASTGTVAACPELAESDVRTFDAGARLRFAKLDVQTIPTSHDAAEPVAVVLTERESGARAGLAYDLGFVSPALVALFQDLDLLVVESNHDEGMLRAGPYPRSVQNRIASRTGHLSNRAAAAFARECVNRGLRQVVLAHLSEYCNEQETAIRTTRDALARTDFRGRVDATVQRAIVGPFVPVAGAAWRSRQLELAL